MAYLAMDAPVFFHARGHGATSAWGGAEAARRWPSRPQALCAMLAVRARAPLASRTCSGYSGELPLVARSSEAWGRGTGGHGTE